VYPDDDEEPRLELVLDFAVKSTSLLTAGACRDAAAFLVTYGITNMAEDKRSSSSFISESDMTIAVRLIQGFPSSRFLWKALSMYEIGIFYSAPWSDAFMSDLNEEESSDSSLDSPPSLEQLQFIRAECKQYNDDKTRLLRSYAAAWELAEKHA
jgi:hypothetical protein